MDKSKNLTKKNCITCENASNPLKGKELAEIYKLLPSGWELINEHHLEKEYKFPDFRTALAFTNKVGEIAENEGHHPDIFLTYGNVKITLFTHSLDGLAENDFIVAAKCDQIKR